VKRTALKRKPTQRNRRKSQPLDEMLAKRYWRAEVTRGGCVMCKAFPLTPQQRAGREAQIRRVEGHHVLAKRHLRNNGEGHRLWDTRNGIGLCTYHHHRHEHWMQRVPYGLIPDGALEFADEVDLLPLLDREYAP
jgi:hypothetical protein